ncbi:RBBP9/YdeN family alpha/beta hydrolase [Aquabacterium sp.]|uniref:RBBP9/YdeN family alpha/beta hydrolase n=1 Tax=Aquabacterium sp. TaxID=1872578 RepID=UPI003784A839
MRMSPTVLIVPGLRDAVATHWQTLLHDELAAAGRPVHSVPPMGREDLDCGARVCAIERAAQAIPGPIVVVAHSGGCIMVAHWALQTDRPVQAALLATPPDFESPLPAGYPTLGALRAGGWLPVPQQRLPFPSLVAASSDDPLARPGRVADLAAAWGSRLVDLGPVGHLNPASGFGPWPRGRQLLDELLEQP